jgi:hypothetical protein
MIVGILIISGMLNLACTKIVQIGTRCVKNRIDVHIMSESNSSMQKYTRGQCVKNLYRIVQDFETAADDEIVQ